MKRKLTLKISKEMLIMLKHDAELHDMEPADMAEFYINMALIHGCKSISGELIRTRRPFPDMKPAEYEWEPGTYKGQTS